MYKNYILHVNNYFFFNVFRYEGKVLLIVNVASKCGLTKVNYDQLNELYTRYEETDGLSMT
jgi:glutathione peroxidase-family protein